MRKANLILLGVVLLFTLPVILASTQSTLGALEGNQSDLWWNATFNTSQTTTNPGIGENVSYYTNISVYTADADWNLSSFTVYLPENASSLVAADYVLYNDTHNIAATTFTRGDYNSITFTDVYLYFNHSANGSVFNFTWKFISPIASTKLTATQSGRAYTETWNITSPATNLTITNASLTVIPTYWYSKIGYTTAVTFNDTTKNSISNISHVEVWTDLDVGPGGNMIEYGSAYETLSITYNGPVVSPSSGRSPTAVPTAEITPPTFALWGFIGLGALFVIVMIVGILVLLGRKR